MARSVINANLTPGSYPDLPIAGNALDLSFTANSDPTSRYALLVNSKTYVLAWNTDSGSHTITFTSVPDSVNRPGDITYTVGAGVISQFGPFQAYGWSQDGAQLWIDVSDAKVLVAVVTLP